MGFIGTIIIGGIAGWLASIAMKTNAKQSLPMDIGFGVVGGFLAGLVGLSGGIVMQLIGSVIGACVLIFAVRMIRARM